MSQGKVKQKRAEMFSLINKKMQSQLDLLFLSVQRERYQEAISEINKFSDSLLELKNNILETLSIKAKMGVPHIEIYKTPEPKRKDSFWFDGHVATVTDGKTTVNVIAQGHVCVYFKPNEKTAYSNDTARKEARSRGYTDKKLKNLNRHDGWLNNNWFCFEIINENKNLLDENTEIDFDEAIKYARELVINLDENS